MRVQVTISGDKAIIQRLEKLGDRLHRWQPELDEIGDRAETYFAGQVFASQGGIISSRWKSLNPHYAAWKAKHYPGRPMLVRSGKMISGFRHTATDTRLEVTNRMPYFKYHQSSLPRKKIPYRPSMAINGDIKDIIGQIIEKGIRKRINGQVF